MKAIDPFKGWELPIALLLFMIGLFAWVLSPLSAWR